MRIAHFCKVFSGLSETFIYDHVTELEQQGATCHVLTLERTNEASRPFSRVHVVPEPSKWHMRRLWRRLLAEAGRGSVYATTWATLRPRLEQIIRHIQPDVIHAHFGMMGVIVAPVVQRLGIPLVVTFYGMDISEYARVPFWVDAYRELFEQAAGLNGISTHICDKLVALGAPADRVHLVHLGIHLDQFEPPAPAPAGPVIQCLHVGRLVEKKAPVLLVRAFHRAREMVSDELDLRLTIAGEGPLEGELLQAIDELGLHETVTLLGAVARERVPSLMRAAHIYTQHCVTTATGDQEGLGVSFIEASATGLPIVSTRHNGLPDVILHEKTGFLVEEGDYEAMAEKIALLARSPALRRQFGAAGRAHIEQHFRLQQQVERFLHLYALDHQQAA